MPVFDRQQGKKIKTTTGRYAGLTITGGLAGTLRARRVLFEPLTKRPQVAAEKA
ncbi:hypothetical protein [Rhizobium sp. Kim5]|uniref:hypothetical protein n=1 Tax=Rhizobium sp. Kim5 TaxID=2020311 RepID=UPI0013DDA683|nr:hypothetical protein [Rhizobium sp. Kim5]